MNVKLLRKVKRQILKEPKQFAMRYLYSEPSAGDAANKIPNCGTAACIAGWTHAIDQNIPPSECEKNKWKLTVSAGELLGIDNEQEDRLFFLEYWPERFSATYTRATDKHQWTRRARIAAERIEHFIKTKGAE